MADVLMEERTEALRAEVMAEMKRERDAGIQVEKLESAKLLKEYREREETYTEELDRLRKELDECTRALEESSEVQKELVKYR